jgi:hypothetical protein
VDYYFDTGPTQAHDFKKTHKKISSYTGTKYSAEVMMSIEEMKLHNWTATMPRKPIKSDFDTLIGGVSTIATVVHQEHLDRYDYKMKSYCKKEDKYEEDMKLRCESMPNTKSGCDLDAPEIEVGCVEFPGVEPFALVNVYFVSKQEDSFIKLNAKDGAAVEKCCKPTAEYNNDDYGVVKYTYKIQCACPIPSNFFPADLVGFD